MSAEYQYFFSLTNTFFYAKKTFQRFAPGFLSKSSSHQSPTQEPENSELDFQLPDIHLESAYEARMPHALASSPAARAYPAKPTFGKGGKRKSEDKDHAARVAPIYRTYDNDKYKGQENTPPAPESPIAIKKVVEGAYGAAVAAGYSSPGQGNLATLVHLSRISTEVRDRLLAGGGHSTLSGISIHGHDCGTLATPKEPTETKVYVKTLRYMFTQLDKETTCLGKIWKPNSQEIKLKGHQVCGISSYIKIAQKFEKITKQDQYIATTMSQLLHDEELTYIDLFKKSEISLIANVTYFLFGVEAHREPGALIVNAMFLDLVKSGHYKMSDIKELPMSMLKAKGTARTALKLIDAAAYSPIKRDPKAKSEKFEELLTKCHKVVDDWTRLKLPHEELSLKHDMLRIVELISDNIKDWFGISSPKFKDEVSMTLDFGAGADDSALGVSPLPTLGDFEDIDF